MTEPTQNVSDSTRKGLRFVVGLAAGTVVVAGLRAASPILVPMMLALFATLVSYPLLEWLRAKRCPTLLAVLGTLLVDALVLVGFGFLVTRAVDQFTEAAPVYWAQLRAQAGSFLDWLVNHQLVPAGWEYVELADVRSVVNIAGRVMGGTLVGVASVLTLITLVLLAMFFMLLEGPRLPAKVRAAMRHDLEGRGRTSQILRDVRRYLGVKTAVSIATGLLVGLWLALLKVDLPLLWGLLAFLLNYIPNLGSIIASLPPAVLALIQHNPTRALLVLAGFLVINVLLGNVLEPQIMGRRLGLSPLVVFLSLLFWGWVWGPFGALLSVPLTVSIRVLLEHSDRGKGIAILLGRGRPPGVDVAMWK
jgi:AI-2 transport protein TqsA